MTIDKGWHKKVREEIYNHFKPNAFTSHSKISELELFRGGTHRQNCLSDADIIVIDSKTKKIKEIIEIETQPNPKKIMGIVIATHLCNLCRINEDCYQPLERIHLKIVYQKAKEKSKKGMKLDIIKEPLDGIIKNTNGCISDFTFEEHD